jgi:SAM-dependent methyltransferase
MPGSIRQLARRILPKDPLIRAWGGFSRRKARRAAGILAAAASSPAWLGLEELIALQHEYPLRPSTYATGVDDMERVARQRLREMLSPVRGEVSALQDFLDLGMWDGTSCYLLQEMGKTAAGIDIRADGLTDKARESAAGFLQMDVAALAFTDNSFDFIFSYNSMEHFPDPRRALAEAWRVARPGGYIYLNFGPIYYSPRGAHQYDSISVPYCECLFTKDTMDEFARLNNLTLTEHRWMNEWSLDQYRALWAEVADRLEPVLYYEIYNADHVDLIARYPTCFRHKSPRIDDFIVANIEVLFRKRVTTRLE